MKFNPITERYKFNKDTLIRDYPGYLRTSLATWIQNILQINGVWSTYDDGLEPSFANELELYLRESFPRAGSSFLVYVFSDSDRTTNILAICLQNYATLQDAAELEGMLSVGGSAYTVTPTIKPSSPYERGVTTLTERVPTIVVEASTEALRDESLLQEAWNACYAKNPDYEKAVSRCCDVIEKLWGGKYFTQDPKPQVKKFVHSFKTDSKNLLYKGSSIVNPKNILSDLAEKFSDIRGQHSTGNGRAPTKEEAEFVLHYTIFLWNVERV